MQNSNFWGSHQKLEPHARFLFLTLTVKNVYDGKELNDCLSKMTKGFSKLFKKI
ncbi:protein rep [Dolosigranulum pigrum]